MNKRHWKRKRNAPDIYTGFGFAGMIFSALCFLAARMANSTRHRALRYVYSLLEQSFRDYRGQTLTSFGMRKEESIRDAMARSMLELYPLSESDFFDTGEGTTLCFDGIDHRYFLSDLEKIRQSVNRLNAQSENRYIFLNAFYQELRLKPVPHGDEIFWDGQVDIFFSTQLADDGTPCQVIYSHSLQAL